MSETKNLKLKKHDNPTTNTNTFDIENYLNGNWDKIDERDEEVKQSIETLQNENIQLKSENQRLKEDLKGLPNAKVVGENIDIKDSAEMRVLEFEVGGNSRQDIRSGKNLLEFENGTHTYQGITVVAENGKITINGTPTATPSLVTIPLKKNITIPANIGYTFRAFNTQIIGNSTDYASLRLVAVTASNPYTNANLHNINSKANIIHTNELIVNALMVRGNENITFNNFVVYPQLEVGDGTDTWEQGGASPSPEYPSEVECCGDNINLFDGENFITLYSNATTTSKIPNGIRATQNTVGTNLFSTIYVDDLNKLSGKKMTLSFDIKTLSNRARLYVGIGNSNATIRSIIKDTGDIYENGRYYLTFLVPNADSTYDTLFFAVYSTGFSSGAINNYVDYTNIKLEEEVASPYSKFGQGNINVEMCNKNKLETEFNENNKLTATADRDGYYTITDYRVYLEADKTYSFSCKSSLTYGLKAGNGKCICYLMLDKQFDYFIQLISNPREFTVTKTGYYYLRYDIYDNNTNASFWDFQVEEGEATNYTPHKSQTHTIPTQQPFKAIEEYKDTFIKKDGKWYERHWIKRLILDGTETFILVNEVDDTHLFRLSSIKLPIEHYSENYICNYFIANGTKIDTNFIGSYVYDSTIRFRVKSLIATTVDDFKTWLSNQYNEDTPVYIDYTLATPEDIECTPEQTEILDKIENAKTYKGVTHIYSTDKVEPNMKVTYLKDIEMMIGGKGVS